MLVLSRKIGESVVIGGQIVVTVVRVDGETVRLGIAAPENVPIHRQEVYDEIQLNNREALTQQRQRVPRLRKHCQAEPVLSPSPCQTLAPKDVTALNINPQQPTTCHGH